MRTWSRRGCALAGAGALAVAAFGTGARAQDAAPDSLNALAAAKGMRFGAAVGAGGNSNEFDDPDYRALMQRECGVLVAENETKWHYLQPQPGVFAFERADAMLAWGEANGIPFRGHTLIWHHTRWLPRWVNNHDFGANPRAEAERLVREHVSTVSRHFAGKIASWDVINETVDQTTGLLRETVLTRAAGYEINDLIFNTAREAAPQAQLVYNDFMDWETRSALHRSGVLRALEQWLGRGLPIHALGIQAHIAPRLDDPPQEREWRAFLDEVTGMGLDLLITEFDVNDSAILAEPAQRDAEVAAYARAFLDISLSYPQMKDVLCWGLTDKYSWLQGFSPRADGQLKRALPYDENFQAKPLREAIADAFRAAPAR